MIKEQILQDIKNAMKEKDNFKRDTLRFLHSAIKQIEIDGRREVSDIEVIKIIQKSIKQGNDNIAQYKEASREELIEKEQKEMVILEAYLPKQLGDDELTKVIEEIIKETGAKEMKDMGKVMKMASERLAGKAEGARINKVVSGFLKS